MLQSMGSQRVGHSWATEQQQQYIVETYTRTKEPQFLLGPVNCREVNIWGLPLWLSGKESACQCRRHEFNPWSGKSPWRRKGQSTAVFFLGEPHGQRSLEGYGPWGRVESDTTKQQQIYG